MIYTPNYDKENTPNRLCVLHCITYVRIARSTSLPCIILSLHSTIESIVTEVSVKIIQNKFFFKLALKVIGSKFLKRLKMIFDETERAKLFFLSFFLFAAWLQFFKTFTFAWRAKMFKDIFGVGRRKEIERKNYKFFKFRSIF